MSMNLMGLFIPLFFAIAVLLVLAKLIVSGADEDRQATETESGQLEFTPNRRSYWVFICFWRAWRMEWLGMLSLGSGQAPILRCRHSASHS